MLEPTWAERARTAITVAEQGHLATLDVDGRPVVGPVPIIDDGAGAPVTVLSNLSTHIQRGRQDHRGAISIGDRVLLQGDFRPVPGLQQIAMQPEFLRRHPGLAVQVESLDFSWMRLEVTRARLTDEDGTERWLRPEDIAGAEPDPLGQHAARLVVETAELLGDDLLLMVRGLSGHWLASRAELVHIDRYGLVVQMDEPTGARRTRVTFPVRLDSVQEIHATLGALVAAAHASPSAEGNSNRIEPRSVAAAPSSFLDGPEGDCSSGADVDAVDVPRHRNSYSLFDALERAGREARTLGSEEDGDGFCGFEAEFAQIHGVSCGREGEEAETAVGEQVEPFGELAEASVGEGERLAHGDPA